MKIQEIIDILESYAPTSLAEDYDNVGLIFGDRFAETDTVLTALDADIQVAREAARAGAGLIITHHPIMFNPVKKITTDTPEGELLLFLAQNNIALYSAHTNLDAAEGGLNDLLSGLLNLTATSPLYITAEGAGIGRVGNLSVPTTVSDFAQKVKEVFSLPFVRFTGDGGCPVTRVAICSGGGGSLVDEAIKSGADVYITGDIKYSAARDAFFSGLQLIEVGHYESEIFAKRLFAEILSDAFGDKLNIVVSEENKNVFSFLGD